MLMRNLAASAGVVCGVLVAIASASAVAESRRCAPPGFEPLTGSRDARLYETRDGFLAGCRFSDGRERILDEDGWFPRPAMDVARTVVGFVSVDTEGVGFGPPTLIVEDLARPAAPPVIRSFEIGDVGVLRITRRGAVAWIECEDDAEEPAAISPSCHRINSVKRVFKRDSLGAGRDADVLLDRGRGIDIRSLGLRGDRVTWEKRGRRRSATIR